MSLLCNRNRQYVQDVDDVVDAGCKMKIFVQSMNLMFACYTWSHQKNEKIYDSINEKKRGKGSTRHFFGEEMTMIHDDADDVYYL